MESTFWDDRYNEPGFAYGKEANDFLKSVTNQFKPNSKILCIAEGEGRNALYLAQLGHQVTALDFSLVGLTKLLEESSLQNLSMYTIHADLNEYELEKETWDVIVCIFGHFPLPVKQKVFNSIHQSLVKDGIIVMEVYSVDQLKYNTGGPQSSSLLYTKEELSSYFSEFSNIRINKTTRHISEGKYHNGESSTIQIIGIK